MDKGENLTPEEARLLKLLGHLIQEFEQRFYKPESVTPREALIEMMAMNHLKQPDIAHIFGSRGITSEVISGKREISKANAKALAKFFTLQPMFFCKHQTRKEGQCYMVINIKQRVALWVGITLVLLTGLFPPWKYLCSLDEGPDRAERPAGYSLIFTGSPTNDVRRMKELFMHSDIEYRLKQEKAKEEAQLKGDEETVNIMKTRTSGAQSCRTLPRLGRPGRPGRPGELKSGGRR